LSRASKATAHAKARRRKGAQRKIFARFGVFATLRALFYYWAIHMSFDFQTWSSVMICDG
jgi:hypothetical protein